MDFLARIFLPFFYSILLGTVLERFFLFCFSWLCNIYTSALFTLPLPPPKKRKKTVRFFLQLSGSKHDNLLQIPIVSKEITTRVTNYYYAWKNYACQMPPDACIIVWKHDNCIDRIVDISKQCQRTVVQYLTVKKNVNASVICPWIQHVYSTECIPRRSVFRKCRDFCVVLLPLQKFLQYWYTDLHGI